MIQKNSKVRILFLNHRDFYSRNRSSTLIQDSDFQGTFFWNKSTFRVKNSVQNKKISIEMVKQQKYIMPTFPFEFAGKLHLNTKHMMRIDDLCNISQKPAMQIYFSCQNISVQNFLKLLLIQHFLCDERTDKMSTQIV